MDFGSVLEECRSFIRWGVNRLKKDGAIVGLSGGLDSTVTAVLARESLGPGRVFALLLPESQADPEHLSHSRELVRKLDIPFKEIDISPLVAALDLENVAARALDEIEDFNKKVGGRGDMHERRLLFLSYRNFYAHRILRVRLRSLILRYHAILKNMALLGTTDRTELEVGWFDPMGDGAADLRPIAHISRTDLKKAARILGVPGGIIEKKPCTDHFRVIKDAAVLGLEHEEIDRIIELGEKSGFPEKTVEGLNRMRYSARKRETLPWTVETMRSGATSLS
jgi:NAD+ synthase